MWIQWCEHHGVHTMALTTVAELREVNTIVNTDVIVNTKDEHLDVNTTLSI